MKSTQEEQSSTSVKYEHSIVFWPFWSAVTVNVLLSVFRSSSVSNIFFIWLVNTTIMLAVGAMLVSYSRKQNVSPTQDAQIGYFGPIIGLMLIGCLLLVFSP